MQASVFVVPVGVVGGFVCSFRVGLLGMGEVYAKIIKMRGRVIHTNVEIFNIGRMLQTVRRIVDIGVWVYFNGGDSRRVIVDISQMPDCAEIVEISSPSIHVIGGDSGIPHSRCDVVLKANTVFVDTVPHWADIVAHADSARSSFTAHKIHGDVKALGFGSVYVYHVDRAKLHVEDSYEVNVGKATLSHVRFYDILKKAVVKKSDSHSTHTMLGVMHGEVTLASTKETLTWKSPKETALYQEHGFIIEHQ